MSQLEAPAVKHITHAVDVVAQAVKALRKAGTIANQDVVVHIDLPKEERMAMTLGASNGIPIGSHFAVTIPGDVDDSCACNFAGGCPKCATK